jgi:signal peptidase II
MWMAATAVIALVADLTTKWMAMRYLSHLPECRYPVVPGVFDFYLQENTGGAFSLMRDSPAVITTLSVAALLVIFFWSLKIPRHVVSAQVAFGLIFGGAIGNLVDRLRFGHVVDFLHVYFRDWSYPTFNVADSCICVGICVVLLLSFFTHKLDARTAHAAVEESPEPEVRQLGAGNGQGGGSLP